jgi:hypothetical protein
LRVLDTEATWQDLRPDELLEYCDILTWLSPDGFRFYYPAYLHYTIANWMHPHDRVHLETVEAIGMQAHVVDGLTEEEALVSAKILTEVSNDAAGRRYNSIPSIVVLEQHASRLAEKRAEPAARGD